MLPARRSKSITVDGVPVCVYEMNGRAYVEYVDARAQKLPQVNIAALLAHHCAEGWKEHSVDDILDTVSTSVLTEIFRTVLELSSEPAKKNSATDRLAVSS